MSKPIKVSPKVYDDSNLRYPFNSSSNRHLCIGGASKHRCHEVAWDVVGMRQDANSNPDPYCTRWTKIEFAICPYPGKPGQFILEDRSEHTTRGCWLSPMAKAGHRVLTEACYFLFFLIYFTFYFFIQLLIFF